jgi:DNA-binding MarR family transcriptional regulator
VYAVLTDSGLEKLRTAAGTHLPQVEAFFAERFGTDEVEEFAGLLERIGDGRSDSECGPGA